MTYAEGEIAAGAAVGPGPLPTRATEHAQRQIGLMAAAMALTTVGLVGLVPERSESTLDAGPWAFVLTAVLFAAFEYTVFNVQFREQGIAFSLSEIPLALALVFLAPPVAIGARLLLSVPVLVVLRHNRGVKLVFNSVLFALEIAVAVLVYRSLVEVFGDAPGWLVASVVLTLVASAVLTSILISWAVSRYEGSFRERVVDELTATWWMYPVTSVLAAMTLGLAILSPPLVLLAALPAAGIWHVLRRFGEQSQELRDLDTLHGFAGRVGRTLDVGEIQSVAVAEIARHMRGEGVALVRFVDGRAITAIEGSVPVRTPETIDDPGWAPLIGGPGVQLVRVPELRALGVEQGGGAVTPALVSPLGEGDEVIGLIIVMQRRTVGTEFDQDDVARLKNITEQLTVSLRRGMLHERLEYEARHDALTGLPARSLFERLVTSAMNERGEGVWAVMMLDLDRFKEVNDTLGHHAGDTVLVEFSERMTALLGPDDHLARLAGDEFAVLCHRPDHAAVLDLAASCVREGGRPVALDGLEIVVTVSVGVADVDETDVDPLQPMRRADIAMYNAKWQRTGVELYRDEIDRRTPARLSMLGDLRGAIESDELDVVFQPKLHLVTDTVVGVEALVRWEHQTRGVVAPAEFVRVAEDTGLIKELTDLVLARGIAALRSFQEAGLELGLAVNLSTHDLFDARLPERVRAYLDRDGVRPDLLTLEITESSLLIDAPRTRATIDDLHAVGLRLAIDDFGTGYSSLSYLRRLPVQELKIDQSFVSGMLDDPQDEVIVRSTVDLGHNLDLLVVAEGVEHPAALARLREIGCDIAQGYGISHPLTAAEMPAWVAGRGVRA